MPVSALFLINLLLPLLHISFLLWLIAFSSSHDSSGHLLRYHLCWDVSVSDGNALSNESVAAVIDGGMALCGFGRSESAGSEKQKKTTDWHPSLFFHVNSLSAVDSLPTSSAAAAHVRHQSGLPRQLVLGFFCSQLV